MDGGRERVQKRRDAVGRGIQIGIPVKEPAKAIGIRQLHMKADALPQGVSEDMGCVEGTSRYSVADATIGNTVAGSVLGIEYFAFCTVLARLFVPAPISLVTNLLPPNYGHAANHLALNSLLPRTLLLLVEWSSEPKVA